MRSSCFLSFLCRLWIIMEFQTSRQHMTSWPYLPVVKASWRKVGFLTLTKLPRAFLWIGQGEVIVPVTLTSITCWPLKELFTQKFKFCHLLTLFSFLLWNIYIHFEECFEVNGVQNNIGFNFMVKKHWDIFLNIIFYVKTGWEHYLFKVQLHVHKKMWN